VGFGAVTAGFAVGADVAAAAAGACVGDTAGTAPQAAMAADKTNTAAPFAAVAKLFMLPLLFLFAFAYGLLTVCVIILTGHF
jgi:hypothetical protein